MKLLRRQVVCRETDFVHSIAPLCDRVGYHSWSWEPLTLSGFKKDLMWQQLQGLPSIDHDIWWGKSINNANADDEVFIQRYINFVKKSGLLYKESWVHWSWRYENDYILLRYRKDRDWHALGMGVVERYY